ncbi:MAG: YceI family protein [Saprospiraceae bacterium]|nr:YceI family protein [Saprospiraceae bacterium]
MKSTFSAFAFMTLMVAFVGLSFTAFKAGSTLRVDTTNSSVQWTAYKVTGQHNGVVNIKSGSLTYNDKGFFSGGSFEIDMTTIKCLDLQGEMAGKLEGHLKSDDFFGSANHPTAKYVITKVVPKGKPGEYKIIGNLTIKSTTKEVKFDANLKEEAGGKIVATGDIKLDRTDFDVRYGSGSFFEGLGDKTIYDEFDLKVKLTAVR